MSRRSLINFRYQVYAPTAGRKVFRIVKLLKAGGAETVQSPEVATINELLLAGKLAKEQARERITKIVESLYDQDGIVQSKVTLSSHNEKIVKQYLNTLGASKSPRLEYDIKHAVSALGKVDLMSGTKRQMEKALESMEPQRRKRIVNKLNTVLRSVGRDFKLGHEKVDRQEIRYLTLADFKKFLAKIESPELRLLHEVCFYTGVTIGEALGLDARTYRPDACEIRVTNLVTQKGQKQQSRLGDRTTVVMPEGHESLMAWFKARKHLSTNLHANASRYTKRAALQAFPAEAQKHITFTDLRHCYAMHLLAKGVPLSLVASCLGVEEKYAKEVYPKFDLGSESLGLIKNILKTG